jgi:hypothetical protein
MKHLTVKLENETFRDAEKTSGGMKVSMNRYISDAVKLYNLYHRRKQLKKEVLGEAKLVRWGSMDVLSEADRFLDEN